MKVEFGDFVFLYYEIGPNYRKYSPYLIWEWEIWNVLKLSCLVHMRNLVVADYTPPSLRIKVFYQYLSG